MQPRAGFPRFEEENAEKECMSLMRDIRGDWRRWKFPERVLVWSVCVAAALAAAFAIARL
jgi:hypothetical protein